MQFESSLNSARKRTVNWAQSTQIKKQDKMPTVLCPWGKPQVNYAAGSLSNVLQDSQLSGPVKS